MRKAPKLTFPQACMTANFYAAACDYAKHLQADLALASARFSLVVSVMNLDNASKQIGTKIDGILEQDVLSTFSAVRI
jgi:hypothetical protein